MKRKNKEVVFAEVAPAIKSRLKRASEVLNKDMAAITICALERELDRQAKKYPDLHRQHFEQPAEVAA